MDSTQQEFPLPYDLLALVLQCPRLTNSDVLMGSMVSKRWRAAAASAVAARGIAIRAPRQIEYELELRGQQAGISQVESACTWLSKYGSQLNGLNWDASGYRNVMGVPLQFGGPCSKLCRLRVLELRDMQLVHHPDSGWWTRAASEAEGIAPCSCGPACPLTALTSLSRLVLTSSGICSGGMCCLSALRALKQLELWNMSNSTVGAALPGMAQLTQLTSLQLGQAYLFGSDYFISTVDSGALLQLHNLQHLSVNWL